LIALIRGKTALTEATLRITARGMAPLIAGPFSTEWHQAIIYRETFYVHGPFLGTKISRRDE
jgi:hypothetical protein